MLPLRDDNPTRITPIVTWAIALVCVALFLLEWTGGLVQTSDGLQGALAGWTLVPYELVRGADLDVNGPTLRPFWLTAFTSMFLHGGWAHLAGNLLFLIVFGNNIEDALGHGRYLLFYLVCGIAAAAAQVAWSPLSGSPMLGASGAIAGVLGAYLVLFPRARVNTLVFLAIFVTTVRLPAWILLGFWIVSQFFSQFTHAVMGQEGGGGVAYLAHIGGFLAGMLLVRLFGAQPAAERRAERFDARDRFDNGRW